MEAKLCSCGKPQSYPILHDYDLTDREHLIKDSSFKAGQQAKLDELAAMAPEGAMLTDEEIKAIDNALFDDPEWNRLCEVERITDMHLPVFFYSHKKFLEAQLAKVAPIYQARLEAEREKVLREVGKYLSTRSRVGYGCLAIPDNDIQAIKSGKMPQEAES